MLKGQYHHTEETRRKISEKAKLRIGNKNPFYGKHHSEETLQKLRKPRIATENMKKPKSEEQKRKQSETMKRLYKEGKIINYFKGKSHSKESIKKATKTKKRLFKEGKIRSWSKGLTKYNNSSLMNNSIKQKKIRRGKYLKEENGFYGKHHSEEIKKKLSKSRRLLWQNEEYKKKVIKSLSRKPSSFEKRLRDILNRLQPNEWKYTGDNSFLIGYKNPDFVNINGRKICIEVYCKYFKNVDYGSIENYKKIRSKHFAKYGWETIFIDENQLNEESVKNILSTEIHN